MNLRIENLDLLKVAPDYKEIKDKELYAFGVTWVFGKKWNSFWEKDFIISYWETQQMPQNTPFVLKILTYSEDNWSFMEKMEYFLNGKCIHFQECHENFGLTKNRTEYGDKWTKLNFKESLQCKTIPEFKNAMKKKVADEKAKRKAKYIKQNLKPNIRKFGYIFK